MPSREQAVREEEIPRNAARNVRMGTPRPRRFNPLTADEARQFLAAAQGHRLAALFELALRTGLRKGELLGLRWGDLDLDADTASIRHTLQRTPTGGLTTLPTKTISSERRIALPASCNTSLRETPPSEGRGTRPRGSGLARQRIRLHAVGRAPDRARHPHLPLQRATPRRGPVADQIPRPPPLNRDPLPGNRASNSPSSRSCWATPTSA